MLQGEKLGHNIIREKRWTLSFYHISKHHTIYSHSPYTLQQIIKMVQRGNRYSLSIYQISYNSRESALRGNIPVSLPWLLSQPSPPQEETVVFFYPLFPDWWVWEKKLSVFSLAPSGFSLFKEDTHILCSCRKQSSPLGGGCNDNGMGRHLQVPICRFNSRERH